MAQASTLTEIGFFASTEVKFNTPAKISTAVTGERTVTLEEVSWHYRSSDCWVVIYDRVYDVTDFLDEHPGGDDMLLEYGGRDATFAFRGTGHSNYAIKALGRFLIGELPLNERIFRKQDGYKLSDMPE